MIIHILISLEEKDKVFRMEGIDPYLGHKQSPYKASNKDAINKEIFKFAQIF